MNICKRFLIYLVAFFTIASSVAWTPVVKAQSLPHPANSLYYQINTTSSPAKIELIYKMSDDKKFVFEQYSASSNEGEGDWAARNELTPWMLKGSGSLKYIIITTLVSGGPEILDFCLLEAAVPESKKGDFAKETMVMGSVNYRTVFGIPIWPSTVDRMEYYSMVKKHNLETSMGDGEFNPNPSEFDTNTDTTQMAKNLILKLRKSQWEITPVKRSGGAPSATTKTQCGGDGKVAKPLFYNATDAEMTEGLAEFKNYLMSNPVNNDDGGVIGSYFNEANNIASLKNYLKEKDEYAYKTFYSGAIPAEYPSVEMTKNLYIQYQKDYQEVIANTPLNDIQNDAATKVLYTIAGAGGAVAAGVLSGGNPYAIVAGGTLGTIAFYATSKQFTVQTLRQAIEAFIILSLDTNYLLANEAYNECAAGQNDPWAIVSPEIATWATALLKDASAIGENTSTGKENACDANIEEGSSFVLTVKKGICAVLVEVKSWADDFFKWALGWLKASLGVQDPNNGLQINTETIKKVTVKSSDGTAEDNGGGGASTTTINISTKIKIILDQGSGIDTKMKANLGDSWKDKIDKADNYVAKITPNGGTVVEKTSFQDANFGFVDSSGSSNDTLTINLVQNSVGKADKYSISFIKGGKEIIKIVDILQSDLVTVASDASQYPSFNLKGDASFPNASRAN